MVFGFVSQKFIVDLLAANKMKQDKALIDTIARPATVQDTTIYKVDMVKEASNEKDEKNWEITPKPEGYITATLWVPQTPPPPYQY